MMHLLHRLPMGRKFLLTLLLPLLAGLILSSVLSGQIVKRLAKRGIETPFDIQALAIPDAIAGRDIYYDQLGRENVEVRDLLEEILTHPRSLEAGVREAIHRYLKLFWINSGPYNNLTARKFVLNLDRATLREAVRHVEPTLRERELGSGQVVGRCPLGTHLASQVHTDPVTGGEVGARFSPGATSGLELPHARASLRARSRPQQPRRRARARRVLPR